MGECFISYVNPLSFHIFKNIYLVGVSEIAWLISSFFTKVRINRMNLSL